MCIDSDYDGCRDVQGYYNAQLIIKAVNLHAQFIESTKSAVTALKVLETMCDRVRLTVAKETACSIREDLEQLLAKAVPA